MGTSYVELAVSADAALTEQLVALFSQLGIEGFWEDEGVLRCYISEDRWSASLLEEFRDTAGLIARSSQSAAPAISVRRFEGKNWNEEWERTIRPIRVGTRFVITPTWHTYTPSSDDIVLTIDPKMSFGTGYHETTRLVLQLMEKHLRPGIRLLDVGTGTGVLAIAGIRLGAVSAVGVDVDEWSFENAQENVRLNGVEHRVTILLGGIEQAISGEFDMIVANIQRSVIVPLLGEMQERITGDGTLILSGLLVQDREAILTALRDSGFRANDELTENEWIALAASPLPTAARTRSR
jgi:ribosomal protein L11 methyltransferase